MSKNASKVPASNAGYSLEGDNILVYDIEYLDEKANKHFVEVKSKSSSIESFEITRRELEKARDEKDFFHIVLVTDFFDESERRIRDVENIFLLDVGTDFFSNNRFKVNYKIFEIRFTQTENGP